MIFNCFSSNILYASTVSLTPHPYDTAISQDLSRQWNGYKLHRIGTTRSTSAIIPIKLSHLTSNSQLTSAQLSFQLLANVGGLNTTLDLYALPYRNSPSVLDSDHYIGELDANSTLIQANYLDKNSAIGSHYLSTQGQQKLVDFINTQLQNGASEEDYIFIRLNPNTANSSYRYWDIASANHKKTAYHPLLQINFSNEEQGNEEIENAYYFDPINGDNSNNGTINAPFSAFSEINSLGIVYQPNDILYLLNGNHGEVVIKDWQQNGYVTIKALNNHNPVLSSIKIINSQKLIFDKLILDTSTDPIDRDKLFTLFLADAKSHHIEVTNSIIQSAADSSTWTKADWYANSVNGFRMIGHHMTLTNNIILNTYTALEVGGDYAVVKNNLIDNFAADAIRGLGSFSIYENNIVRDCYIDDYAIQHDDGFQAYNLSSDPKIKDVIIRNNQFILFADPVTSFVIENKLIGRLMQGIIITDGYADGWIVENNLVVNAQYHGISLFGARNSRIQNNTVIQSPHFPDSKIIPRIYIDDQRKTGQKNFNNVIRNNLAAFYTPWTYDSSSTIEYNIKINGTDLTSYHDYFIDYANGDYRLVENSEAINAGLNEDLLKTDLSGKARIIDGLVDVRAYEYEYEYE